MPEYPVIEPCAVIEVMDRVRTRRPLIHCLTNQVAKSFTANVLLAIGASPAMVEHPEEAEEFARVADALLVNLGTLDAVQMEAMRRAIAAATVAGKPWVLDPVAVGLLGVRTRFAGEILAAHPTVIRGNASEVIALAGENGGGRGVDSGRDSRDALAAARMLAGRTGGAVLVTGAIDQIVCRAYEAATANGHPLMTRVTGMGCAMGAISAACTAVADSPFLGSVATAVWLGVAGEIAAGKTARPGSFQTALLDALDAMDDGTIRTRMRNGFGADAGNSWHPTT